MQIRMFTLPVLLLMSLSALAQESDEAAEATETTEATEAEQAAEPAEEAVAGVDPDAPKQMSGMSILGNEEAPKSLVIVPWKSSQLGDDLSLTNTLDDRARPIDKDVFLRELSFYQIRSGEKPQ